MSKSTTSLTIDYLSKLGWNCWVVEKRLPIPGKFVTQDCYNFADVLGYHATRGIALIQTTSWGNFTTRRKKVLASPHSRPWLTAGGKIAIHGWGDKGLREEWL